VLKFVGIALVLWLLVTRFLMPVLRQLAIPPPPPPVEERPQQQARETVVYQDNLQAARQIARQDPKVVATVVKEWVGSE
jgi:flagellar M-ring protein FliF